MTQPLALVVYEKLLPGSQLLNRLQDLNYRVQAIANADSLVFIDIPQFLPLLISAQADASLAGVASGSLGTIAPD